LIREKPALRHAMYQDPCRLRVSVRRGLSPCIEWRRRPATATRELFYIWYRDSAWHEEPPI